MPGSRRVLFLRSRSATLMTVFPALIWSPSQRSATFTFRPLTDVPFVLSMSISRQRGGLISTVKWTREKNLSFTGSRKCANSCAADDEMVVPLEGELLAPREGH